MNKYVYIYGEKIIKECLIYNKNKINCLYVNIDNNNFNFNNEILKLAKKNKIKINYVNKFKIFNLIKINKNEKNVLEIILPKYFKIDEIINNLKNKKNPLILMLDEIFDSHNFGAIIRTSYLFNVDAIIIKNKKQVEINSIVAKSSSGAFNYIPICKVNNLSNVINLFKKNYYFIYSACFLKNCLKNNYKKITDLIYDTPIVLIFGNEKKGISLKLINNSDYIVYIPTKGYIDSLNVSVAVSIFLFYIKNKQNNIF